MKNLKENKKETFLNILSCATPKQINDLIESRGKEAKPIPLVVFMK